MITQIIRPFSMTKNFLKSSRFMFSLTPTPNQGPKNNQHKPQINAQVGTKADQKPSEPVNSISRAQARLRVSRAQLAKYARVELEYEKLHSPGQKMELVAKQLSDGGFKIKLHPQLGTRLQFYRQAVAKRKPTQNQKQKNQSDQNNDLKSDKKQQEPVEEQEQDPECEIKVFTSAQRSFVTDKERKFLQAIYKDKKQTEMDMKDASQGFKNMKLNVKLNLKEQNSKINKMFGTLSMTNDFQKPPLQDDDGQMYPNNEDSFKEFTIYMRNGNAKSLGKWVKVELMMQDLQKIHIYKISLVKDMERELLGAGQANNEYRGMESKEMEGKLIEALEVVINHGEDVNVDTLTSIYCYTMHSEAQHYRKWLQDLIDITK